MFAAKRLAFSGVDEIHSSPMGRALETAQPLADLTGLPVIVEDWAWELRSESHTSYPDGVLHTMSQLPATYFHQARFRSLGLEQSFDAVEGMQGAHFKERYHDIARGLDGLLARCGYRRNDEGFYDIAEPNDRHVALFCHCAMQRVLMSHLYHVPYQFVAASLYPHFTGVTALYFETDASRKETMPLLLCYGDVGHFYAEGERVVHSLKSSIIY